MNEVDSWLMFSDYEVDDDEKADILRQMFSKSAVAAIYGSACVVKSTLINHLSNHYYDVKKLYLAQTHSAVVNLRRRVTANADHCEFMTVESFKNHGGNYSEYEFLIIDESNTVSNKDMNEVLDKAHYNLTEPKTRSSLSYGRKSGLWMKRYKRQ